MSIKYKKHLQSNKSQTHNSQVQINNLITPSTVAIKHPKPTGKNQNSKNKNTDDFKYRYWNII